MAGVLEDVRVVEGSAFVAIPPGGMTLAQLGADVIRFDPIGGGLDYNRWPVTTDGKSLFWAGFNKGPILGKHTDQILLEEFGLSEAEVGKLHDEKTAAGPQTD